MVLNLYRLYRIPSRKLHDGDNSFFQLAHRYCMTVCQPFLGIFSRYKPTNLYSFIYEHVIIVLLRILAHLWSRQVNLGKEFCFSFQKNTLINMMIKRILKRTMAHRFCDALSKKWPLFGDGKILIVIFTKIFNVWPTVFLTIKLLQHQLYFEPL